MQQRELGQSSEAYGSINKTMVKSVTIGNNVSVFLCFNSYVPCFFNGNIQTLRF